MCVCTYACVCISRMCLCAPVFDVNGISLMVEERASARVSQRQRKATTTSTGDHGKLCLYVSQCQSVCVSVCLCVSVSVCVCVCVTCVCACVLDVNAWYFSCGRGESHCLQDCQAD